MTTPDDAILLGYDGSPDSQRALAWAMSVAERQSRPLHVLVAEGDLTGMTLHHRQALEDQAGRTERDVRERLSAHRATPVSTQLATGRPAEALIEAAAPAAMLVVGARGHSAFAGALAGSVSQHVAHHAPCTVVVVREPYDPQASDVVVGVDGSPGSELALDFGFQQAAQARAALRAVHAQQPSASTAGLLGGYVPLTLTEELAAGEQLLAEAVAGWPEKYPEVEFDSEVVPLHPYRALTDASERAALLVVGTRGRGAFARLLLGSVGQAMLHHARSPVALVR
jgi:nucleotide-binding universal stress UspA family protein